MNPQKLPQALITPIEVGEKMDSLTEQEKLWLKNLKLTTATRLDLEEESRLYKKNPKEYKEILSLK